MDDARPGFVEIDVVGHNAVGQDDEALLTVTTG
jgi:hypothetical protein